MTKTYRMLTLLWGLLLCSVAWAVTPQASTDGNEYWYQITSKRSASHYITAQGRAAEVIGSTTTANLPVSHWKFVKRTDNTYDIVNREFGCYISPESAYNTVIKTVASQPAKGWTVGDANTANYSIISCGEVQLNQTGAAQNYRIYNWSDGNNKGNDRGDEGCQLLINEAGALPEPPTEPITYTVSKPNGSLFNKNGAENAAWNVVWRSTVTPQLTFTSDANNMNWAGDNIQMMSGSSASATYTLEAPYGTVIESYSFKLTNNGHTTGMTVSMNGSTFMTSAEPQLCAMTEYNRPTLLFTLTGPNNNGVVISDFTVTVKPFEGNPYMPPTVSTEGNEHWYYITNASSKSYCAGKVMYYDAQADRMKFGDKNFTPDRIWSFWEVDGKLAIKNYNGKYMGTAGAGTGASTAFGAVDTPNAIYSVIEKYGFYIIKDNAVELHAQNDGKVIVRWGAEEDGASLWMFDKVDVSHPQATLAGSYVKQGKVTTGIGNKNEPVLRSLLRVTGLTGTCKLQGVKGRLVMDDLKDVKNVKAYIGTDDRELFVDEDKRMTWREPNGLLLGTITEIGADGAFAFTTDYDLSVGDNYLWIACDIADDATEGHKVDAVIEGYTINGDERPEANGNPDHALVIFLSEGSVLMPYDCGSRYYRIPSITTVKKQLPDGTVVDRLVTLTDDRLQHGADLPKMVYVVAQYSDDLGKSWSRPVRVAGTPELGGDYGHGDASLVTDRTNGNIIGIMTAAGTYLHGFWASTAEEPQLWKTIISKDGGETWSAPVDHTKSLYGVGSPNPHWTAGFSGSGAALQKRDGTLVSSFVNRQTDGSQNFFFFMSEDGGNTWSVRGTSGTTGADEPKTLERNNGDLSIFVRAGGYNFHNVTSDNGETWKYAPQTRFTTGISGAACNGEYMVWCSTLDGNPWNIALETLPNSGSRQNVSICLSTDEGETFGAPKTICPWSSAYSTCVVLPDGSLGVYYEEDGHYNSSNYVLRFVRFSLDWASDGKYKFTEDQPFHPIPIQYQTGVESATAAPQAPAAIYDLQGRKVTDTKAPGVYIKGGKKVLVTK